MTLTDRLKKFEGYRAHPYRDSLGYLTIGYGRLVEPGMSNGISELEATFLLENDIAAVYEDLADFPWFLELDRPRQECLIEMAFQLGVNGLLGFRNMLHAVRMGQWDRAYAEALDSRWARQTPNRAEDVARRLRDGTSD